MHRAPAAAGLLVLTVLAGCIASPQGLQRTGVVQDALTALGEVRNVSIPMADGVRIHGTVYLPKVPEGAKVPVVMDLGPYYGNLGAETYDYNRTTIPNRLYANLLNHSYAIALVSVRGTGLSEGCFAIGGSTERSDAAAIVEWLARQPWSNGNVGMTGVSYDGTTPWEALVTGTPALKAIVPVEGITDMYNYTFFDGVPFGGGPLFNTYYPADVDFAYTNARGLPDWAQGLPSNVCPETARVVAQGYATWMDGVHGPYWQDRDQASMLDKARAPTLVVHGFQDWNVRMDEVQNVWAKLPEPKRMLLGQWEHNIPWRDTVNSDWSVHTYNTTVRQWFDAFLKGDASALAAVRAAPPVQAQDSSGAWWNLTAWPPAESALAPLYLGPAGNLSTAQPARGERSFDAKRSVAGGLLTDNGVPAPALPGDGVRFASPTTQQRAVLMGNPSLRLNLSVDQAGGYLVAQLFDMSPQRDLSLVTKGYLSLPLREDREKPADVPVGTPFPVTVKMYAVAHVLQPGHKLVLALSGNGDDTYPNPQYQPTYTLHLGGEQAALELPVLQGELPADWPPGEDQGNGTLLARS